jgi:hypothetical protein
MGLKGYRLWAMGKLDSTCRAPPMSVTSSQEEKLLKLLSAALAMGTTTSATSRNMDMTSLIPFTWSSSLCRQMLIRRVVAAQVEFGKAFFGNRVFTSQIQGLKPGACKLLVTTGELDSQLVQPPPRDDIAGLVQAHEAVPVLVHGHHVVVVGRHPALQLHRGVAVHKLTNL